MRAPEAPARRLLVVTRSIIAPAHHGGCAYPAGLLAQLAAAGWEIHLLWLGGAGRPWVNTAWAPRSVHRVWVPGAGRCGRGFLATAPAPWVRALARRLGRPPIGPDPWALPDGGAAAALWELEAAAAVADRVRPAAWLVNHTRLAGVLTKRGPARGWLLTHEVVHQRALSHTARGLRPDFPVLDETAELAAWSQADGLLAISPDDAEAMAASRRPVRVVPPLPPASTAAAEDRIPGRVLLVGSANVANRDALDWLQAEIWPRVRRDHPTATLDVVGYLGRSLPSSLPPGVQVRDHVDDLRAAYARASVVVVPVRAGAGLKLKLWEALHHGRPVVTTTEGARGWTSWRQAVLTIADDPEDFARSVVQLLADPAAWTATVARQDAWRATQPPPTAPELGAG